MFACMGLDVGEIGMGLDLGLDLRLFAARSAGRMSSAAKGGPAAVDACIRSLEEERQKIEVFKRELPLCVRLLADGKKGLLVLMARFGVSFFSAFPFADEVLRVPFRAVIEELKEEAAKRGGDAVAKADDGDKRKWMSTAQLWVDSEAKSEEVRNLSNAPCYLGFGLRVYCEVRWFV